MNASARSKQWINLTGLLIVALPLVQEFPGPNLESNLSSLGAMNNRLRQAHFPG
jgi:hypothetical protein